MKLVLSGIHTEWGIQAVAVLIDELGVKVVVAKAIVDALAASGRIEVPFTGVDLGRLRSRLIPFGVSVEGPEPSSGRVDWLDVVDTSITVAEFNALVGRHVPELLAAVRDEQVSTAETDGIELRDEENDPTIVYQPLVFWVLPTFIRAATHPIDPDALTRFNAFLMALEERLPGLAAHDLMPMWLRTFFDEVPESLSYFDPVLLAQEADMF